MRFDKFLVDSSALITREGVHEQIVPALGWGRLELCEVSTVPPTDVQPGSSKYANPVFQPKPATSQRRRLYSDMSVKSGLALGSIFKDSPAGQGIVSPAGKQETGL